MAIDTRPKRVAVIGAGVTGLLIAQGLKKNGLQVTVYERDPSLEYRDNRPVSFLIHWGFESLKEILPGELWSQIHTVFCNPADATDLESPGVTFFQGHTGELLFQAPPTVMRRMTRQKLRRLATTDIEICWNKTLESFQVAEGPVDSVSLKFSDGSEATADVLVGADGPRSQVRGMLLGPEKSKLTKSDYVCGYTSAVLGRELAEKIVKAHPIWTMAYHSAGVGGIGVEDAIDPNDMSTWVFNVTRLWRGESPPVNGDAAIDILKEKTQTFCDPFKSAAAGIPAGSPCFVRELSYWKPIPWPNHDGKVTLAGDAAHPMLPFRGQGLNHAMDDALRFVRTLTSVSVAKKPLKETVDAYDADVVKRGGRAVETAVKEGNMVHNMDNFDQTLVSKRGLAKE